MKQLFILDLAVNKQADNQRISCSDDRRFGALISATYGHRNVVQQGLDTFSGYSRFTDPTDPGKTRFGSTDMRAQNIDDDRTKVGVSAVSR